MQVFYKRIISGISDYREEFHRYMFLLLAPLVIGLVLMLFIHLTTVKEIEKYGNAVSQSLMSEASAILNETETVSQILAGDSSFIYLATLPEFTGESDDLIDILHRYVSGCDYIYRILLINKSQGYIYSDKGRFLLESADSLLGTIGVGLDSISCSGWHMSEEGTFSPYLVREISSDNAENTSLLVVMLNIKAFYQLLYQSPAYFCCVFNDSCCITSELRAIPNEIDWRSKEAVQGLLGIRVDCFYIEEGDFTYLTAISTKEYHSVLRITIYAFSVFFLLILTLGIVYLWHISRKRYLSYEGILKLLPIPANSEHNEAAVFKEVQTSLENYRDNKKQLDDIKASEALETLVNNIGKCSPSIQQIQAAGLIPSCKCYLMACFFVDDITSLSEIMDENPDIIHIINITLKTTVSGKINGNPISSAGYYRGHIFTLIFSVTDPEFDYRQTLSNSICESIEVIERTYGIVLSAIISSPVQSFSEFPDTIASILRLHRFVSVSGSAARYLSQSDFETGSGDIFRGNYLKQLQIIINTLLAENYESIPDLVRGMLKDCDAKSPVDFEIVRERTLGIGTVLKDSVISSKHFYGSPKTITQQFAAADTPSKLSSLTDMVFRNLIENAKRVDSDSVVSRAKLYMNEQFANPNLTVPVICENAMISVSHLSRIFKQESGQTITEYLNDVRISYAKSLLAETDKTIASIAVLSGYSSTDTFVRNFKHTEGIAPSEYRSTLKK